MIAYTLRCAKNHEFEGWFKNSDAYDDQRKTRKIECPVCGDRKIDRAPSRPNISTGKTQSAAREEAARKTRALLREFRRHVESTHENVGDRFAEEARKIHYGETDTRDIYGKASADEARDLIEEGVAVAPLPWIEEAEDN